MFILKMATGSQMTATSSSETVGEADKPESDEKFNEFYSEVLIFIILNHDILVGNRMG